MADLRVEPAAAVDSRAGGRRRCSSPPAIGAAVSLGLGVYANVHDPTNEQILHFGFPSTLSMKAWLTTGVAVLAAGPGGHGGVDVGSPARRRAARRAGSPTPIAGPGRRRSCSCCPSPTTACGRSAGATPTPACVVHGLLGCAFFGALTTKLLALRINGLPGWALPVLGGGLVAILTGIWLTSSLWFFTNVGFPGL